MHNTGGVVTFSAWVIAPFVAAWQLRRTRFGTISLVLGLLAMAASLYVASITKRTPDDPVGLGQRLVLLPVFAWFVLGALEFRQDAVKSNES